MGLFDDITIRSNGDDVYASWWNDIRTALVNGFGSGIEGEGTQTVLDNQSSYVDLTGWLFDKTTFAQKTYRYTIIRDDDGGDERREVGYVTIAYKPTADTIGFSRRTDHGDDALNVADSLTVDSSSGQVSYKSDSMGGTYTGTITWKCIDSINLEA